MNKIKALTCAIAISCCLAVYGELPINYQVSLTANAGSGDFAPFYMMSNVHGTLTQPYSTLLRASASKEMDSHKRFSYGFGADVVGGYTSRTAYRRYDKSTSTWVPNNQGPAPVWLQQLYAEVKYRSLFLSAGLKERGSVFLNDALSSGDMAYSANARPIPAIRAGFIDFQDIPLTQGWVQIRGELSYGISTDEDWRINHFHHGGSSITTGKIWYSYKYLHFRTNPDKPFSFLIGMQTTCQFGGIHRIYSSDGEEIVELRTDMTPSLGSFFKALIPMAGNTTYYEGNHLGTWDVMGRYKFRNGHELRVYYQSPWEDGSGIGKLNGWDGMYGIEFRNANPKSIVSGAVIEYIDLTNQSGPLHWDPADFQYGYLIPSEATGGDDYYNNVAYNGYQLFGQAIGSPFVKSPIYNTSGSLRFFDNSIQGFHVGITGNVTSQIGYRLMASYRKSWGTSLSPSINPTESLSMMLEGNYEPAGIPGLSIKAQIALDKGNLLGDNFGGLVSVSYNGLFNL